MKASYVNPATPHFERWWSGSTIADVLMHAAQSRGPCPAVIDGEVTLTFEDLWRMSGAVATRLDALGVGLGDPVAVQLPNWWEAFVVYAAVARIGAVCNPLPPLLRKRELVFIFDQSRAKVAVIPGTFRSTNYTQLYREFHSTLCEQPRVLVVRPGAAEIEPFEPFVPFAPPRAVEAGPEPVPDWDSCSRDVRSRDVALLMYTSGTTADPKGVMHHHDSLLYEVRSIVDHLGLGPSDTVYMVSPLSHISGYLFAFLLVVTTGAAAVLQDIWENRQAVELIERHACRFTLAAPIFLQGLLDEYRKRGIPSSLRYFLCGGASVPAALAEEARSVLGTELMRTYGLTEMPTLTAGRPGAGVANLTTDGFLIGPVQCRVEGDGSAPGELLIRGPELFCGYLDPIHNDAFDPDGYFRTGDVAHLGPDSTVTIVGRLKDIIVRGGEKISAREVEEALLAHPDVDDVAVVAVPHDRLGEQVGAVIVPSGAAAPTLSELSDHLSDVGLARQKHPEHLATRATLPRTGSGKVQKHLLRYAFVSVAPDR